MMLNTDHRQPVAYIRRSVLRVADPGDASREFQIGAVRDLAGPDADRLSIIDCDWGRSAARRPMESLAWVARTDAQREGFQRLLADIEAGHVSTVYAYSNDRLACSVLWSAQLIDSCEDTGVTIVTNDGSYAPGDGLVFKIRACLHQAALEGMQTEARGETSILDQVQKLDASRERVMHLYEDGHISLADMNARMERLAAERERLERSKNRR